MLYQTIQELRQRTLMKNLETICRLFGISRQAYYQYFSRKVDKNFEFEIILEMVRKIRYRQPKIGVRKLFFICKKELIKHQIKIGRDAMFDLLRQQNLLIRKRKRRITTTLSFKWLHSYPNLIKEFVPLKANELWVSDITYIETIEGVLYLSLITDGYSRKIVGNNIGENLSAQETLQALEMALLQKGTGGLLYHHSDRGVQYCCKKYVAMLKEHKIEISMTENGDPYENAIAERINGTLKNEMFPDCSILTNDQAKKVIIDKINVYNNERPHLSCDMLTPEQAHKQTGELKKHWKKEKYADRFLRHEFPECSKKPEQCPA